MGPFACTPRHETAEDRLAVVEETDLTRKAAAYAIGDGLRWWDDQGSIGRESVTD